MSLKGKAGPKVASIHTSFNIFRNIHDSQSGEVTVDEQIKAMERFVRWHQRQVEVGQQLVAQLVKQRSEPAPNVDAVDPVAEVTTV